jgi:ribosomal protein S18 acetylase RimI-like enzyme
MPDESMLANPVWHALNSEHRCMKRGKGSAACYGVDVSRLAGLALPTHEAFSDLATLVPPDERAAVFTAGPPEVAPGWHVLRSLPVEQMVCHRLEADAPPIDRLLGADDVPDMLTLAAAAAPGPFTPGTMSMGRFFGIRSAGDGRLVAMAGERLRLAGYTEISTVCTDPASRGRGYARNLVAALSARVLAEGSTPFLHVNTANGAKRIYESLGFRVH